MKDFITKVLFVLVSTVIVAAAAIFSRSLFLHRFVLDSTKLVRLAYT